MIDKEELKKLSLEELTAKLKQIDEDTDLAKGLILLEIRSRFKGNKPFGVWCKNDPVMSKLTTGIRYRLMAYATLQSEEYCPYLTPTMALIILNKANDSIKPLLYDYIKTGLHGYTDLLTYSYSLRDIQAPLLSRMPFDPSDLYPLLDILYTNIKDINEVKRLATKLHNYVRGRTYDVIFNENFLEWLANQPHEDQVHDLTYKHALEIKELTHCHKADLDNLSDVINNLNTSIENSSKWYKGEIDKLAKYHLEEVDRFKYQIVQLRERIAELEVLLEESEANEGLEEIARLEFKLKEAKAALEANKSNWVSKLFKRKH